MESLWNLGKLITFGARSAGHALGNAWSGAKAWVANKWSRFKAWLRPEPPISKEPRPLIVDLNVPGWTPMDPNGSIEPLRWNFTSDRQTLATMNKKLPAIPPT